MKPIVGTRYRSLKMENTDFCEECFKSDKSANKNDFEILVEAVEIQKRR